MYQQAFANIAARAGIDPSLIDAEFSQFNFPGQQQHTTPPPNKLQNFAAFPPGHGPNYQPLLQDTLLPDNSDGFNQNDFDDTSFIGGSGGGVGHRSANGSSSLSGDRSMQGEQDDNDIPASDFSNDDNDDIQDLLNFTNRLCRTKKLNDDIGTRLVQFAKV